MMCRRELGIGGQLLADLFDQLLRLVEVGVVGDADRHLVDDPVAAHVLHRAELAEGHGVERPAMVPQLHRAEAEGLDRALVAAALDVLADPEGVVEQVEDAADDVLAPASARRSRSRRRRRRRRRSAGRSRRRARTAPSSPPRPPGPRRRCCGGSAAACAAAPAAARFVVGLGRAVRLGEPAVDSVFSELPQEVGDEQDDDRAQRAPHEPGREGVAAGQLRRDRPPRRGRGAAPPQDQERPQAALDIDGCEARGPRPG